MTAEFCDQIYHSIASLIVTRGTLAKVVDTYGSSSGAHSGSIYFEHSVKESKVIRSGGKLEDFRLPKQ